MSRPSWPPLSRPLFLARACESAVRAESVPAAKCGDSIDVPGLAGKLRSAEYCDALPSRKRASRPWASCDPAGKRERTVACSAGVRDLPGGAAGRWQSEAAKSCGYFVRAETGSLARGGGWTSRRAGFCERCAR